MFNCYNVYFALLMTAIHLTRHVTHMGVGINPHTVVKKLHPNPVLRGPHGPRGLFQVKRHFTSWQKASLCLNISTRSL